MDDLLDLDWHKTTSPINTTSSKHDKAAGSRPAANVTSTAYSSYNFDALTRSLPSISPSLTPSTTPRPSAPATTSSTAPKGQADDAFSSLLSSFGNVASSSSSTTASMADRQKASLLGQNGQSRQSSGGRVDAWSTTADWDALEGSSPSSQPPQRQQNKLSANKSAAVVDPFDGFDDFAPPAGSNQNSGVPTKATALPREQSRKDVFDFSFEEDPGEGQSSALGVDGPSKTTSVTNDFNDVNWNDDFLGVLGKPVQAPQEQHGLSQPGHTLSPTLASSDRSHPPSPPPHLLGRIVEMGFSPSEARKALAKTSSGLDVEAALDSLLNGGQQGRNVQEEEDRQMAQRLQTQESRDIEMEDYEEREHQRRITRRGKPSQPLTTGQGEQVSPPDTRGSGRHSHRTGVANAITAGQEEFDWQKQADQIYSQASELGATVFTKANAFWSSAKAQAQKTLEERQLSSAAASSGRATPTNAVEGVGSGRASPAIEGVAAARVWARRWGTGSPKPSERKEWEGKPRWLVEAETAEAVRQTADETSLGQPEAAAELSAFKDSDNEEEAAPSFLPTSIRKIQQKQNPSDREVNPQPVNLWEDAPPAARFKVASKAAQEEAGPKPYLSSARWASSSRSSHSASALSSRPAPLHEGKVAPVVIKKAMVILPADLSPADSTAVTMKARGNEAFKKGAYGEAEAAYSAALERLPDRSLRRIPLLNNRANARLKNGDAPAASRDAGAVIQLICSEEEAMFEPSKVEALPGPLNGEVSLRESYSKALLRRAQAGEMSEKWLPALKDWTLLEKYEKEQGSGAGSGFKNLKSAQDGIRRCRGMMAGDQGTDRGAAAAPASGAGARRAKASREAASRSATSAVRKAEQAGVERVRAANAAQAAEEAAADALKDSIDSKVTAWKAGKETNVRALLSSLENVVWEGLGWKKVGMHEVITEAQVKKAYTRAMIKLHPDKLTPQNTQLEHRLIGSAVFAVLNEAFAASTSK